MADNYLERRVEELNSGNRGHSGFNSPGLERLLSKTKNCSSFDPDYIVMDLQLQAIVRSVTLGEALFHNYPFVFHRLTKDAAEPLSQLLFSVHERPNAFIIISVEAEAETETETETGSKYATFQSNESNKLPVTDSPKLPPELERQIGALCCTMALKAAEMGLQCAIINNFDVSAIKQLTPLPSDTYQSTKISGNTYQNTNLPGDTNESSNYPGTPLAIIAIGREAHK